MKTTNMLCLRNEALRIFSAGLILSFTSIALVRDKPVLTARNIHKNLAKVTDSLYTGRCEVSNGEYNIFLKEIAKKDSALYWNYRSDSTKWFDIFQLGEPMTSLRYHSHPAFADYPVVNIKYEGAEAYCQWLTEIYNSDPKRKFRNVKFTLPAAKEWTAAAQGGHPEWKYPWGNYYLVNKRGYFMCNFKPVGDPFYVRDSMGDPKIVNYKGDPYLRTAEFPDYKVFYTMKVKSFSPNGFGIYNTSGNVAEMTLIRNYAMGGSWNNYGGEINSTSIKKYNYPAPEVGFRVFMKIIEQ
jgi:formylglycine-generating enzyme required for sulfatase activity